MLKTVELHSDLIEELVLFTLNNGINDLSSIQIVFPSKRMGVFYRDFLMKKVKKSFFPPKISTIDNFILDLFNLNYTGFRKIENIEATMILYKILQDVSPGKIYMGELADVSFPDFFPWGLKIFNAIENIMIESREQKNINQKIFDQFVDLGDYHQNYKEFISLLPDLIKRISQIIEEKKLTTRGYFYKKTAQLATEKKLITPEFSQIIFAGFNALNYSEEKILKYFLSDTKATLMIRTNSDAVNQPSSPFYLQKKTVSSLGLGKIKQIKQCNDKRPSWDDFAKNVTLKPSNNIETQMFEVFGKIQGLVKKYRNNSLTRIAVVLPDPSSLIPFVQGVVSRFNQAEELVPFNITLGYPFQRTPLYQLITSILKIGETAKGKKIYARDYLDLIRHPYVKLSCINEENEFLRRGIHILQDIINKNNLVFFDLEQLEVQLEKYLKKTTADEAEIIQKEVQHLHLTYLVNVESGFKDLLSFLKATILGVECEKSYLFLWEYISTAVDTLEQLEGFMRDEPLSFQSVSFSKSSDFIKFFLSKTKINFEGSPLRGIQVMGMLEFRGLKFDEVLVVDAIEGILPETLKYDPILPYDIKNVFNMRTYTDWEKLFSFNFFSLLASSKNSSIFWPEKQQDSEKKERSRFIEKIIFESENKGVPIKIEQINFNLNVQKTSLKIVEKEDNVRDLLKMKSYSPSSLSTYIKCPLKFYFERILKLKEREKIEESPEAGTFGTIIHDILSKFYSQVKSGNLKNKIEDVLRQLIEDELKQKNFNQESGMIKIRSWLIFERLRDYLEHDLQNMEDREITIDRLEYKVSGELILPEFSPVKFSGIIDRIEQEGEICRIVDYKTGKSISDSRLELLQEDFSGLYQLEDEIYFEKLKKFSLCFNSMQLLLYLKLLSQKRDLKIETMDACYVYLKESGKWEKNIFMTRKKPWDKGSKISYLKSFEVAVSFVFEDIINRKTFIPNTSDSKYCSFCQFQNNCGII